MSSNQINVTQPSDILHWTGEFEVNEQQLRHAVRAVGPSTEKVRRFLNLSRILARNSPSAVHLRQAAPRL